MGLPTIINYLNCQKSKKLFLTPQKNNIRYLDTAITYKKTNLFLRKINLKKFKITSKLPMIKTNKKEYSFGNI